MGKEMKIGIMPRDKFREYTLAVARGKRKLTGDEPKVWFDSIESMTQVLSTKNQELLKTIKERNPNSISELAILSGRKVSNLSRTLKGMQKYGVIKLQKEGRTLKPLVGVDVFHAVFSLK
ncbi:MAG: transcriptional regulator [Syntrophales bacterium]